MLFPSRIDGSSVNGEHVSALQELRFELLVGEVSSLVSSSVDAGVRPSNVKTLTDFESSTRGAVGSWIDLADNDDEFSAVDAVSVCVFAAAACKKIARGGSSENVGLKSESRLEVCRSSSSYGWEKEMLRLALFAF